MISLIWAILFFIVGSLAHTLYAFGWKLFKDPTTKFDHNYIFSALISMIIAILATPLFFIPGALPLAVAGDVGIAYIIISSFSIGLTINYLVNKPVAHLIVKIRAYEAAHPTKGVVLSWKSTAIKVIAVAILIALVGVASVYAVVLYQSAINTTGTIQAYGVQVYSDSTGKNVLTSVSWGLMSPGETVSRLIYIKNTGNAPITLLVWDQNWLPVGAQIYFTLTNSYINGTSITPQAIVPVTLTLTASPTITGITNFSFDIIIEGPAK